MKSKKYILFALCSLLFLLAGCRPKGILHSWELRAILVDLHKTDAMLQVAGYQNGYEEARTIYYAQVLEKHGITQAEFDSSIVWYTAHPQLFDKIYPKVLKELEKEETAFIALHEEDLNLLPEERDSVPVPSVPNKVFKKADLDSVLWVIRYGRPHSWHEMPSMHNLIDQLFPELSVSNGGVVDTLETGVDATEIAYD